MPGLPDSRPAHAAAAPSSSAPPASSPAAPQPRFTRTPEGISFLDVRQGTGPEVHEACTVSVAYTGRLAAKNGWVFASQPPEEGEPLEWSVGASGQNVVAGLDVAVRGMRVGGVRRVVVPPLLGYVDETTRPVPSEFWQRRRLYSTVFNETRRANGEGDTLATTIWDLQVLRVRGCNP